MQQSIPRARSGRATSAYRRHRFSAAALVRGQCVSEFLESRVLLSTTVVNTTIDGLFPPSTGIVSLRNAIVTANSSSTPTTIAFDPNVFAAAQTIMLNGTGLVVSTNQPITITGPAAGVTINGNGQGTVFQISGATADFSRLTITNGSNGGISNSAMLSLTDVNVAGNTGSTGNPGGISNSGTATLTNVTVSGNTGYNGAGIFNGAAATLTLINGTISGNTCTGNGGSGGGIYNLDGALTLTNVAIAGNTAGYEGGGILNAGRATLSDVTVSGNTSADYGGGIDNGAGPMSLTNVTITGNIVSAATYAGGGINNGGISISGPGGNFTSGTLTVTNATIFGNTGNIGGGISNLSGSTVTVSNSIIAGNVLAGSGATAPDASGSFNSLGFNLVGKTDGGTGWNGSDLTGTVSQPLNPMLALLGNYGGPTQTMPPLPGSPAIDAGFNAFALNASDQPLTTDQRGMPRIFNGTVDIGAVEYNPLVIDGTSGNDSITLTKATDGTDIDWTMGASSGVLPITNPTGLTIIGNGGSDTIVLNYGSSNANPLPNTLHLNGTFTINGLQGTNPLANTTVEIGRSTVFISYSSSDPLALIQGYLKNGYNNGSWNATPTASTGVITSTPAANNALQTAAIGYADSADGLIPGQPANTIELKYTLYGDTTLAGTVGSADFTTLTLHYHQTTGGTWDTGDFNYDGSVNFNDFTLLTRTYNTSLGSQASPAMTAAVNAAATSSTPSASSVQAVPPRTSGTETKLPAVQSKPTQPPTHHVAAAKQQKKHRR